MSSCRFGVAAALLAALVGAGGAAQANDLILTAAKPNRLYVIDPATHALKSEIRVPDISGGIGTIVPSPDGRVAYLLVNRMESIVGVDLASGKVIFRADLSGPTERVKDFFGFTVTPDGRELIAYELPTKLLPSEYVVQEPRFVVFKTSDGLKAKVVRQYPAPRRVHMLLMRPSGRSFYAVGFDLFEYDVSNGKLLGTRGIQNWQQPGHAQPDLLAFWPVSEPSGVFATPIYSEIQGGKEAGPVTGLMTLDLASGALDYRDFETTSALIFSTVLAPDRKTAYGVYTTLTQVDVARGRLANRVPLDHTFYSVNISSDGRELFLGGTNCDVAFYDAATLEKKTVLKLPGCPDQSLSSLRVIRTH